MPRFSFHHKQHKYILSHLPQHKSLVLKFFHYPMKTMLGMWYGFVCDAKDRCTDAQIAEYIGMPRWLVGPMKGVHAAIQIVRKKR